MQRKRNIGPFAFVPVSDDTSLDYISTDSQITSQHYAFLVDEIEFDEIFARVRERRLSYWADPGRQERDQINTWDGGRGLYFEDPNGHLLEIITRSSRDFSLGHTGLLQFPSSPCHRVAANTPPV
jgi:catechol 2,3-dioxygenase-like lactoylglutathione lyase family enzyme